MKEYATRTLIGDWFTAMTVTAIVGRVFGATAAPGTGALLLLTGLMPPAILLMLCGRPPQTVMTPFGAGADLARREIELVSARVA